MPGEAQPVRDADFQRKIAAVRCHASQLVPLGRAAPELLRAGGVLAHERYIGVRHAHVRA